MRKRNDRRPERRKQAIARMESYNYDNSRAKRLGTSTFEQWYLRLRKDIERLTA